MKVSLENIDKLYQEQIIELCKYFNVQINDFGKKINIRMCDEIKLTVDEEVVNFLITSKTDLNILFKVFIQNQSKNTPYIKELTKEITNLTYMLDASRNAVIKVDVLKELIIQLALFGYDSIQLYTEDTFEIEGEPYFGYLRGRYTSEEISEIDKYTSIFGLELVPCIQTLAHFNAIERYHEYNSIFDVNDILLVDENETYVLIEKIIKTSRENFKSKKINIGMDEAYMIGRGLFLDKHGFQDKFDIMIRHLNRVLEICKKYDFKPMMWSDMFFKLALDNYYESEEGLSRDFVDKVPKEVSLIYWDYYKTETNIYNEMLLKHKVFDNDIYFAGGAWKWIGFTPDNRYSLVATKAAMTAAIAQDIDNIIVTAWGDNGAEASQFSILPSLAYYGSIKFNNMEIDDEFKKSFELITKVPWDLFMIIDLANQLNNNYEDKNSSSRNYFYNDILLGLMDTTVEEGYNNIYKKHLEKYKEKISKFDNYKYIFQTQLDLLEVLTLKTEIGVQLREAYKNKNLEKIKQIIIQLNIILEKVNNFYNSFKLQWFKENKPFGFDVQDLRIGGLIQRINSAIARLSDYIEKKIDVIEELEEPLLDYYGKRNVHQKLKDQIEYSYQKIVTVNINK